MPSKPLLRRPKTSHPLAPLLYNGTYTLLLLLLLAIILITPGDHIYQAFRRGEIYHIFIVAGVIVLTAIVGLFVYVGRMVKTRRGMGGVMRVDCGVSFGKGEAGVAEQVSGMRIGGKKVTGRIEALVTAGWGRSAVVAWAGWPRELGPEDGVMVLETGAAAATTAEAEEEKMDSPSPSPSPAPAPTPVWGHITHAGWSSPGPSSQHLLHSHSHSQSNQPAHHPAPPPHRLIHFETVIIELPSLLEAKAVSLAPLIPLPLPIPQEEPSSLPELQIPDPLLLTLLRRPPSTPLSAYIAHLQTLSMLPPAPAFLALYDRARFSGLPLSSPDFHTLMTLFSSLLAEMRPVSEDIVADLRATAAAAAEADAETMSVSTDRASDIVTAEDETARMMEEEEDGGVGDVWAGGEGGVAVNDRASMASNGTVNHTPRPPTRVSGAGSPSPHNSTEAEEQEEEDGDEGSVRRRPGLVGRRYVSARSIVSGRQREDNGSGNSSSDDDEMQETESEELSESEGGSVVRFVTAGDGGLG